MCVVETVGAQTDLCGTANEDKILLATQTIICDIVRVAVAQLFHSNRHASIDKNMYDLWC